MLPLEGLRRTGASALAGVMQGEPASGAGIARRKKLPPDETTPFCRLYEAGCGRYAEIWSAERWEENNLNDEPENFTAELEKLGL